MAVCDLANGVPLHADAIGKGADALAGLRQMIQECHSAYVPHQGTARKDFLCPSGALGYLPLLGHIGDVLQNNIKRFRKERGMTQEDLAAAIGTTRNMLVKLEGGSRGLTTEWLEKIGEALDLPPYLLIAPDSILPTEAELAEMLSSAQQTLPAGLPYSEWPLAVARGLHLRLRTLAGDRASAGA